MQQPMDSYVCGVNTRSENFSFYQIQFSSNEGILKADTKVKKLDVFEVVNTIL